MANASDSHIINVTHTLKLSNLDIPLSDINWTQVKLNSSRWIAVRQKLSFCSSFNSNDELNEETCLTIINPYTHETHNCQASGDTNCAQMNPFDNLIAISNDKFLAVYSSESGKHLHSLPFASKCIFWNWINGSEIVIVSETQVSHWSLNEPNHTRLVFKLDQQIKSCQITNYKCDRLTLSWFAVSGLYVDDEGEIIGLVQVYSQSYQQTQCIEAHAINFTTYKFIGNSVASNVLLAAKRTQQPSQSVSQCSLKIYIIELGPIEAHNSALVSRTESIPLLETNASSYDFPVQIECSDELGLVYIMCKFAVVYVCDVESGAFIYSIIICESIIFATAFNNENQGLIALSRGGHVMSIELNLQYLIQHLFRTAKHNIAQRLQLILERREDCDQITRL